MKGSGYRGVVMVTINFGDDNDQAIATKQRTNFDDLRIVTKDGSYSFFPQMDF